jgi:hypothetical protein
MATTISEAVEFTEEDVLLVSKWGGPRLFRAKMREVVLVGRLQRALIAKAPDLAEKMALRVVDGRMGPHTRRTLNEYNGTHPEDPIELGPELAQVVAASAEVPEPPITLDALEDPPEESELSDEKTP